MLYSKSFYEFDKYFISKQFEYSTMDEYYADISIDSRIQNIQVPTVFLNSSDDMLSPVAGKKPTKNQSIYRISRFANIYFSSKLFR